MLQHGTCTYRYRVRVYAKIYIHGDRFYGNGAKKTSRITAFIQSVAFCPVSVSVLSVPCGPSPHTPPLEGELGDMPQDMSLYVC